MNAVATKLRQFKNPSHHSTVTATGGADNEMEIIANLLHAAAHKSSANDSVFSAINIKTPIGTMVAVSNETHLLLLTNIGSKHLKHDIENLYRKGSIVFDDKKCNAKPLLSIENELKQYFDGTLFEFHTPLYVDRNETEFQRSVWHHIHQIEFGQTSSYTRLAQAIGKPNSYRAVANACGRNPFSIVIPCHRVLKADQSLGGYSSGIERKVWLLDHEKNVMKILGASDV